MADPQRKRRSFLAPFVTLLASIVLGAGSCFGFLSTLNINGGSAKYEKLSALLLIVFCVCVLAFPISLIWIIVRAVRNSRTADSGRQ